MLGFALYTASICQSHSHLIFFYRGYKGRWGATFLPLISSNHHGLAANYHTSHFHLKISPVLHNILEKSLAEPLYFIM